MSVVTIQLGQYGNQMGIDFFNMMSEELSLYPDKYSNTFFRKGKNDKNSLSILFGIIYSFDLVARALLVDMEEKVVLKSIEDSKKSQNWSYENSNKFVKESGAGNNWAYGYCRLSQEVISGISELIRKEMEQGPYSSSSSSISSFLLLHSLAGGTGSGLGSYLTQYLKDEYPNCYVCFYYYYYYYYYITILQIVYTNI
jgi:tubulin delta